MEGLYSRPVSNFVSVGLMNLSSGLEPDCKSAYSVSLSDVVLTYAHHANALVALINLALDKISPHNWLDDTIWLKKAYLESRSPLLINSNWWLAFMPDLLKPHEYHITEGISSFQLRRAAWLVHRILEFKHKLKT